MVKLKSKCNIDGVFKSFPWPEHTSQIESLNKKRGRLNTIQRKERDRNDFEAKLIGIAMTFFKQGRNITKRVFNQNLFFKNQKPFMNAIFPKHIPPLMLFQLKILFEL